MKKILSGYLAKLINLYRVENGDFIHYENFDYWQKKGFHIIPNHYYQPIPDTSKLGDRDFKEKQMIGVDLNIKGQLKLLSKLKQFRSDYNQFEKLTKKINTQKDPSFYFNNLAFDNMDALVYYGIIRHLNPKNVIEVGSGWSTKIAAKACIENGNSKLTSIEPYPQPVLKNGFNGFDRLIDKKIQDVPLSLFKKLGEDDILFIDSSHNVRIGGDVYYLFLEVLPRLKKGVWVHIHDIFFPFDYPRDWVMKERRFWTEQYLLHAFLLFNDTFKIMCSNSYLIFKYPKKVKRTFPNLDNLGGGSFWVRKIRS